MLLRMGQYERVTAIELTIDPRDREVGSGAVRRLLPWHKRRMVGPFIFLDIMGPADLDIGTGFDVNAHPHIGLSTVTYLFAGRAVHRDSTGAVQTILPGDVNWMTAGAGVAHTERSHIDDRSRRVPLFGVQTWVALPDGEEDTAARFEHLQAGEIPRIESADAQIAVAVGVGWGESSPIVGSSPLLFAEVGLGGGEVKVDDEHPERAVLALDGDVRLDGSPMQLGHLAVLTPGESPTLSGDGRAIVLGGEPVGARHIWWNFVHSDLDRIEHAKQRWIDQTFPQVPDDHDGYVRLPG